MSCVVVTDFRYLLCDELIIQRLLGREEGHHRHLFLDGAREAFEAGC